MWLHKDWFLKVWPFESLPHVWGSSNVLFESQFVLVLGVDFCSLYHLRAYKFEVQNYWIENECKDRTAIRRAAGVLGGICQYLPQRDIYIMNDPFSPGCIRILGDPSPLPTLTSQDPYFHSVLTCFFFIVLPVLQSTERERVETILSHLIWSEQSCPLSIEVGFLFCLGDGT